MLKHAYIILNDLELPTKEDFDNGDVSSEFNELVDIIVNFFIISNNMRKERSMYIILIKDNIVIHIHGESLRYLAADFRSSGSLFVNALTIIKNTSNKKVMKKKVEIFERKGIVEASPGIIIRKINALNSIIDRAENLIDISPCFQAHEQSKKFNLSEEDLVKNYDLFIDFRSEECRNDCPFDSLKITGVLYFRDDSLSVSEKIVWLNFLGDRSL